MPTSPEEEYYEQTQKWLRFHRGSTTRVGRSRRELELPEETTLMQDTGIIGQTTGQAVRDFRTTREQGIRNEHNENHKNERRLRYKGRRLRKKGKLPPK